MSKMKSFFLVIIIWSAGGCTIPGKGEPDPLPKDTNVEKPVSISLPKEFTVENLVYLGKQAEAKDLVSLFLVEGIKIQLGGGDKRIAYAMYNIAEYVARLEDSKPLVGLAAIAQESLAHYMTDDEKAKASLAAGRLREKLRKDHERKEFARRFYLAIERLEESFRKLKR